MDSIPWLGQSPAEGNDNPLQYSCLKNPVDRGTLLATIHRISKSWMMLNTHTHTHTHTHMAQQVEGFLGSKNETLTAGAALFFDVLGKAELLRKLVFGK